MSHPLQDVCDCLGSIAIEVSPVKGGYLAGISLDVRRFSDEQVSYILECLSGYVDAEGTFRSYVCNNNKENIVYNDKSEAQHYALLKAKSLPKQFAFAAYCNYGFKLTLSKGHTIMFIKRN